MRRKIIAAIIAALALTGIGLGTAGAGGAAHYSAVFYHGYHR